MRICSEGRPAAPLPQLLWTALGVLRAGPARAEEQEEAGPRPGQVPADRGLLQHQHSHTVTLLMLSMNMAKIDTFFFPPDSPQ